MTTDVAAPRTSAQGAGVARLAGKYLVFCLASEQYGIRITKVKEIIRMQTITHVPRMPDHVRGLINLRGKVIPVMDLHTTFGMATMEDTPHTCIIVVQIQHAGGSVVMGVVIDEVREVLEIAAANIEESPSFGDDVDTSFILGIAKTGNGVKMLLDIDRVLGAEDVAELQGIVETA